MGSRPESRIISDSTRTPKRQRSQITHAEIWEAARGVIESLARNVQFTWYAEPVDTVKLNIPQYDKIILHKMDLRTIRESIDAQSYSNLQCVKDDVALIVRNAVTFNSSPVHVLHTRALTLRHIFDLEWSLKVKPLLGPSTEVSIGRVKVSAPEPVQVAPTPKPKPVAPVVAPAPPPVTVPTLTHAERAEVLTERIQVLLEADPDAQDAVLEILSIGGEDDEMRIDLEACDGATLDRLESFITRHVVPDRTMGGDDSDME